MMPNLPGLSGGAIAPIHVGYAGNQILPKQPWESEAEYQQRVFYEQQQNSDQMLNRQIQNMQFMANRANQDAYHKLGLQTQIQQQKAQGAAVLGRGQVSMADRQAQQNRYNRQPVGNNLEVAYKQTLGGY
jgi:hypothetical protein